LSRSLLIAFANVKHKYQTNIINTFHQQNNMSDVENNAPEEALPPAVEAPKDEEAVEDYTPAVQKDVNTDDGAVQEVPAPSGKSLLVYYNALSRIVMAGFLTAGGAYAIPKVFNTSPTQDFKYCAIFFIIGTGLFLICTLIDFMGAVGNGRVAMLNSVLYIFGAAALEAGSIAFYPGVVSCC
jgi:hypothetical protein